MASLADFSSIWGIPEKHLMSDGERKVIFNQSVAKASRGHVSIPNNSEAGMSSNDKRPYSEYKSDKGGHKRARKAEHDSPVGWSSEFASCSSTYEGSHNSVGDDLKSRKSAVSSDGPARNVVSSISSLPWFRHHIGEEDRLELPSRLSFFPGYFEDGHRIIRFDQPEEIHLPVFDYSPPKPFPVGPNHQADVPTLRSQGVKGPLGKADKNGFSLTTDSTSADVLMITGDLSEKYIGTSVMPMPDFDTLDLAGRHGNKNCWCSDEGSIRCMRQHVMEGREKLSKLVGKDRFTELGFYDMGEIVAQKWTEKEQELFHLVVTSNPASCGKNFWDVLPRAFPSRSRKELVSYYFNVFILRKRARQNRLDPLNVDSDDDEWQETDDTEFATTEEDDDDSVVESPADSNNVTCNDSHAETESYEEAEGRDGEEHYRISKEHIGGLESLDFTPKMQTAKEFSQNDAEDPDAQDGSCTSFEGQHSTTHSYGSPNDFVETQDSLGEFRSYGLSIGGHEYLGSGYCDQITWGMSHMRGIEKDVDLLPTCNVIEEFGKGSWESSEQ